MTGLDKLVHPTRGILLSGKWEGTPDAGSNLGNPEGIMLREKINLRWPHTVWFHLHNLLTMRRAEGDQISGCRAEGRLVGVVGVWPSRVAQRAPWWGAVVYFHCVVVAWSYTLGNRTRAHTAHCSQAPAPWFQGCTGLGATRRENWVKGAWALYCLCNLLLFHYCLQNKDFFKKEKPFWHIFFSFSFVLDNVFFKNVCIYNDL